MKSEPINFIRKKSYNIQVFLSTVKAGFPSPAENYISEELDLNDYLIEHPTATFFVRVSGESMTGGGINDGDLLIVDKSLQSHNGFIVIVILDGEFKVKKLKKKYGSLQNGVRYYHFAEPSYHKKYSRKVLINWLSMI